MAKRKRSKQQTGTSIDSWCIQTLSSKKKAQLVTLAKSHGIDASGTKADLLARLLAHAAPPSLSPDPEAHLLLPRPSPADLIPTLNGQYAYEPLDSVRARFLGQDSVESSLSRANAVLTACNISVSTTSSPQEVVERAVWVLYKSLSPPFLLGLPDELLVLILQFVGGVSDVASVRRVCSRLARVGKDNYLWWPMMEKKATLFASCGLDLDSMASKANPVSAFEALLVLQNHVCPLCRASSPSDLTGICRRCNSDFLGMTSPNAFRSPSSHANTISAHVAQNTLGLPKSVLESLPRNDRVHDYHAATAAYAAADVVAAVVARSGSVADAILANGPKRADPGERRKAREGDVLVALRRHGITSLPPWSFDFTFTPVSTPLPPGGTLCALRAGLSWVPHVPLRSLCDAFIHNDRAGGILVRFGKADLEKKMATLVEKEEEQMLISLASSIQDPTADMSGEEVWAVAASVGYDEMLRDALRAGVYADVYDVLGRAFRVAQTRESFVPALSALEGVGSDDVGYILDRPVIKKRLQDGAELEQLLEDARVLASGKVIALSKKAWGSEHRARCIHQRESWSSSRRESELDALAATVGLTPAEVRETWSYKRWINMTPSDHAREESESTSLDLVVGAALLLKARAGQGASSYTLMRDIDIDLRSRALKEWKSVSFVFLDIALAILK